MIPVKNYSHLYRDEKTNAILNTDETHYQNYINSKYRIIEEQNRLSELENEISEIKSLLKQLLENK